MIFTKHKIGVVVPVISQYEKALQGLASIRTGYTWTPIIIPNWKDNYSVTESFNRGIYQAIEDNCDFIVLANDDIVYGPGTIDALVHLMEQRPDIVVANGYDYRATKTPEDVFSYTILNPPELYEDCGISALSMIRNNFIAEVGEFDENIYPGYFEDNDMSYRFRLLGLKTLRTNLAPYYHYGSSSQNAFLHEGRPIVNGDAFMANHDYLMRKWGTDDWSKIVYTHPFNDANNDPKEWRPEWRPR